ncbi:MAG: hypothetical protein NT045_08890 [Candidatus Aureabacteria bacterium]|nr:hypothetical protein [Candidatus Auribacterota bacterium]
MKENQIGRGMAIAAILAAMAAVSAWAEQKTIARQSDPVVVTGETLKTLRTTPLSQIALYSARGGTFSRVPSQIDERDGDGVIAVETPDGTPLHPDDNRWDDNDDLVFMARDLGDRVERDALPGGHAAAVEIECTDPVSGAKGWAYCLAFRDRVRDGPGRYVNYDLAKDYVTADCYELGYTPGQMKSYFSTLILKDNDGVHSANILDRYKFRVRMNLFFSLITISRNEDDMRSVLVGYKDGPIRAIRRCTNSMYLKFGIRSPSSVVDNYYYRDSIEWPTLIKLPFNVSTIASEAFLVTGCDWNPQAEGMRFLNSCNTTPVLVDGVMSEEEKRLDKQPYLWSAIVGSQGSLIARLWLSPSLVMGKELLYIDDKNAKDPPEDLAGHWGYNGWTFNITTVTSGTHRFISYFYFPKNYAPGDEKPYLDILDHPLRVSTRAL